MIRVAKKTVSTMILFYFFSLFFSAFASIETVDISSPRYYFGGNWQGWKMCPNGTYAYAARLKVQGDMGDRDDTALNTTYIMSRGIFSGQGPDGLWRTEKFCPEGLVMIGFTLRSDKPYQKDNVGAVNFAAYCGTPDGPRDRTHRVEGDSHPWGEWSADQFCPKGFAVCGINTQIMSPQPHRNADQRWLDNVDLRCCRVPRVDLHCTPQYFLERLTEYDNRQGAGTITIQYEKKVSFTKTTGNTRTVSQEEKEGFLSKVEVGVEVGFEFGFVSSKTSFGYEQGTSIEKISAHQIQNMVQNAMTKEETITETYNVPAYKGVIIEQLYMSCGNIRVGLSKIVTRSVELQTGSANDYLQQIISAFMSVVFFNILL
uniref:Vitelline membrane outer layer protein 1 n=1 Tax=Caenorhabditis tropicalis TaxID=1561998 RepID=A0A1I7TPN2_9PELO